ncbi:MAG: aminopeptidase [Planctomycetes bacterium]|nr:aminopeptidase [Planctomycetota bacterium]
MVWNANLRKLAKVLVQYSTKVETGDDVAIMGSDLAAPLVREVYREVLIAGGHPSALCKPADLDYIFYQNASEEQLDHKPPVFKHIAENFDAVIRLAGEPNTKALSGVDSQKIAYRQHATEEVMATFMERAAEEKLNWVLAQFPTHSCAQDAEMSLTGFQEFYLKACKLNSKDPVSEWEKMQQVQETIVDSLEDVSKIHILSQDTDLRMSTEGRKWISCAGLKNYPDGEVFTGPVEDSAEGHIRFNFPGIYCGKEIQDIRLTFENGEVKEATAGKGQDLLEDLIETDEGASKLGELGVGTNNGIQRFTKNMLFDEKMGGTIHLALGRGYPESGSKNESGIHWDLLCDMKNEGKIYGDEELIYEDGKFKI